MSGVHKEYRYNIQVQLMYKNELIDLEIFNIRSLSIKYNYTKYNNPLVILNLKVDRKIKNAIISNLYTKDKNFINLMVDKFLYDSSNKDENNNKIVLKERCIFKRFDYIIEHSDTVFNKEVESEDSQDYKKLESIIIGLYDKSLVDKNKIDINTVVKNSNLSSLLLYILNKFNPILIEPFVDKPINQLIIPPHDSIKKLILYISKYYNIYDDSNYILFHDFDKSYFISKRGNIIKARNDKYLTFNIEMNDENYHFIETNGAYYNDNNVVSLVSSNTNDIKVYETKSDNIAGKLGIVSSTGKYKEVEIFKDNNNINTFKINTPNVDIADVYKNEILLSIKLIELIKSGLDTFIYTINKEYNIINNETKETLKCLLVEKNDVFLFNKNDFILNTTLKFRVVNNK